MDVKEGWFMPNHLYTFRIDTTEKQSLTKIDHLLDEALEKSGVKEGVMVVYCPHTTAAITINENADPDVQTDLNLGFNESFPNKAAYRHMEGNSDGHMKSSVVGASETFIITEGRLILGTWQSAYFFEFDGPRRQRKIHVKIIEG